LLIYPAAILFLRGLPSWMVDPVLSPPALRLPIRVLTQPVIAGLLYTLIISVWHIPWAYDWALQNKTVHIIEHLMFFAAGLLYWWPLLSPSRIFPPIPYGSRMIYLFGVLIAMTPVFAYITFSPDILYPTYEFAPRIFPDFTAGEDQLAAGVSMKLVGLSVALAAFGVCFFRWSKTDSLRKPPTRFRPQGSRPTPRVT
jgi:putative membrane protein